MSRVSLPPPTPGVSKVELRFSCKKLLDMDILSKSDPQIYVYYQDFKTPTYQLIGKTEKIMNNLNPVFKTPVTVDYHFEEIQNLKIVVVDIDEGITKDSEDYIGDVETQLGSIISKPGGTMNLALKTKKGKPAGHVQIVAEELKNTLQSLRLHVSANNLDKKDFFGKSDPYFIISKKSVSGDTFVKVYESYVIKKTLDPIYKEFDISLDVLNAGDMERQIKIDFYDWDAIGKHDYIGSFITNVSEMVGGKTKYDLINAKKRESKGSKYKNSGVVTLLGAKLISEYRFLDFILGGCEISLICGIDCTASNKPPHDPSSLHYHHPTIPNKYATAISSIGSVLAPYDTDGLIPVFGFGGLLPGTNQVSHCFPMGITNDRLVVAGVNGILDVYYNNISRITLHGPTYFAPIINQAAAMAQPQSSLQEQKYTILLIITDGEILDMDNTIDAIVKASTLPLSIVIVGVGNANFDNMNKLDGDDGLLCSSSGVRAERDIVQFVAIRDFESRPFQALAAETLIEIPGQLTSYFKKYNIAPHPPRPYIPEISSQSIMYNEPTAPVIETDDTGAPISLEKNVSLEKTI